MFSNGHLGRGIYFKRELAAENPFVHPIHFAIPGEKINIISKEKTKTMAFIDPRDRRTYVYETEEAYYGGYAESLFAVTTKKSGWDCLRHYEIMANQCIPLFIDIEKCPSLTMVPFPKFEIWQAKELLVEKGQAFFETSAGRSQWDDLNQRINSSFVKHGTTVGLAKYLLDVVSASTRSFHRFV